MPSVQVLGRKRALHSASGKASNTQSQAPFYNRGRILARGDLALSLPPAGEEASLFFCHKQAAEEQL